MSTRRMLSSSDRTMESSGKTPAVGTVLPLVEDGFPGWFLDSVTCGARDSAMNGTMARRLLLRICTNTLRTVVTPIGANDPARYACHVRAVTEIALDGKLSKGLNGNRLVGSGRWGDVAP